MIPARLGNSVHLALEDEGPGTNTGAFCMRGRQCFAVPSVRDNALSRRTSRSDKADSDPRKCPPSRKSYLRFTPESGLRADIALCPFRAQKQKFTTNSPYSLLRAIRPRGRSRHLAVLAQPVQGLMLTEAAQFEMADFKDRCRNFCGKSTSHEQWPANILAEEVQPAEDVDVTPDAGEVEAIARANIAVCGITIVQSNIDGNMLLDLGR